MCDNRKVVIFEKEFAKSQKCIDSNVNYLFKYTKICQSLQWVLEFPPLDSWPAATAFCYRLPQYSVVRASCEFNYLKEKCRKRSRKVIFVGCNQSGPISTVSFTFKIVSILFEPRSNCQSCSPIFRWKVVVKRTIVDNIKITDVWTTSGRGKSHKRQIIAT